MIRHMVVMALSVFVLSSTASGFDEPDMGLRKTDPISRYFMAPFADDFIRPEAIGLEVEEVSIRNQNGESLRGWWLPYPKATHTVMFCMGNTGNISSMLGYALILHKGGFNVFLYDYQGYGKSTGIATALSLHGDTLTAFDYLVSERGIEAKNIGIFGVSLGSVLAIAAAAEKNAGAVAVEDVFLPSEHVEAMKQQLGNELPIRFAVSAIQNVILPKVDPMINIPKLKCPLLLMHGIHDQLLPPTGTLKAATAATAPVRVWMMQGAGHAPETLEVNDQEYATQIQSFFRDAFQSSLHSPVVTYTSTPVPGGFLVRLRVAAEDGVPIQISIASATGQFQFLNCFGERDLSMEVSTSFEPVHVFAVRFHHTEQIAHNDRYIWKPALSELSGHLLDYRILESAYLQRRLMRTPRGRLNQIPQDAKVTERQLQEDWAWLKEKLPTPSDVHPRVRPRYARLIARFWSRVQPDQDALRVDSAELMLAYLPEDPAKYFELNNAEFFLGFVDFQVSRALVFLSRHKIKTGDTPGSRALMKTWYHVRFPGEGRAGLSLEQIDKISSIQDIEGLLSE
ncbi:MAG: alpha/beta hydrolase [Planctomyces sp.]|nr:alpha/beta hydrolase [Planctomyces sp.]